MKIELDLQPFGVPNYVTVVTEPGLRQDGLTSPPSYPLAALHPESLAEMCDDFRRSVFEKAGRADPRLAERKATAALVPPGAG